jgi:hypothetical protein
LSTRAAGEEARNFFVWANVDVLLSDLGCQEAQTPLCLVLFPPISTPTSIVSEGA